MERLARRVIALLLIVMVLPTGVGFLRDLLPKVTAETHSSAPVDPGLGALGTVVVVLFLVGLAGRLLARVTGWSNAAGDRRRVQLVGRRRAEEVPIDGEAEPIEDDDPLLGLGEDPDGD